eukprot:RCo049459
MVSFRTQSCVQGVGWLESPSLPSRLPCVRQCGLVGERGRKRKTQGDRRHVVRQEIRSYEKQSKISRWLADYAGSVEPGDGQVLGLKVFEKLLPLNLAQTAAEGEEELLFLEVHQLGLRLEQPLKIRMVQSIFGEAPGVSSLLEPARGGQGRRPGGFLAACFVWRARIPAHHSDQHGAYSAAVGDDLLVVIVVVLVHDAQPPEVAGHRQHDQRHPALLVLLNLNRVSERVQRLANHPVEGIRSLAFTVVALHHRDDAVPGAGQGVGILGENVHISHHPGRRSWGPRHLRRKPPSLTLISDHPHHTHAPQGGVKQKCLRH